MSITLNSLNVPALISSFPSFCNCSGHNLHVNRLRLEQVIFSQHLPQAAPLNFTAEYFTAEFRGEITYIYRYEKRCPNNYVRYAVNAVKLHIFTA